MKAGGSKTKTDMPEQEPKVRARNFGEVALGYSDGDALREAARCLGCKSRPCVAGCPVNVKIPEFIELIGRGDFEEAYKKIRETNALPAVCGRVCPQESQCEKLCVRGRKGEPVGIGRLERFAADWNAENAQGAAPLPEKNGISVAVVGSGPAGLSCAGDLALLGYDVTIFEAFHVPGGVLAYGIPEFRLPKAIVAREIENLKALGVKVKTNVVIGKSMSVADLLEQDGYKAVFIGSGAGLPLFLNIEGEMLNGVYFANEFLTRINLMKAYDPINNDTPIHIGRNVAVVGGGNVAADAARCAMRLGAERVRIIYRRTEQEMPARAEELRHARDEGVELITLAAPLRILGNAEGWAEAMVCVEMELGEPDESGRRAPHPKEGREFTLPADTIVIAVGQLPNPLIKDTTPGLNISKRGGIVIAETGETSLSGVYAGGDAVTGAATVILAMGAGKTAAAAIHEKLINIGKE